MPSASVGAGLVPARWPQRGQCNFLSPPVPRCVGGISSASSANTGPVGANGLARGLPLHWRPAPFRHGQNVTLALTGHRAGTRPAPTLSAQRGDIVGPTWWHLRANVAAFAGRHPRILAPPRRHYHPSPPPLLQHPRVFFSTKAAPVMHESRPRAPRGRLSS